MKFREIYESPKVELWELSAQVPSMLVDFSVHQEDDVDGFDDLDTIEG